MRDVLFPAGYVEVKTPLVFNKALWETSGHWAHYRQNMFLDRAPEGEQMGDEGDELPGALPALRERGAQLSRPAAPLPRADAAASQRSIRRAVGADARAAVFAGRCALLRHAGPDWRRSRAAARGSFSASTTTSACSSRRSSSTRPTEFLGEFATWDHAEAQLKEALDARGQAVHHQRGRRRVLRTEDRLRRHRRDRAQVAVRDDSARLP